MIDFSSAQGLTIPVMAKKVKLLNRVPEISIMTFSLGSSSGTCEMSTAHTKYGSTALCNTGVVGNNEMYAVSSQTFHLIPDHFYYACVEVYQETKLGSVDYFWPSASPSMFGGYSTGSAGTWTKLSNVTTRSSFTTGDYPIRLDFNNGGTEGNAWYDGLMLIDLTEAFGAGNEPDNAWCRANIPYFAGSMELGWEFKNLCPAINGTEGFTVSGGTGTKSIEASTTHTKYAAQSLKMSLGSDCSEVCVNSTGTYPLDASHVYYFRIEGYQEVKYGTMEMYFPIAEPKPFNIPAKEAGQWNIYSAVCDRSSFSSGDHRFRIDFNNGNTYANSAVWYDGVMIIDLTAACGAGNEPSKEWCDANIPYFTGTTTILSLSSPAQASVMEIKDASGRVIWEASGDKVILEVEKITNTTYAGETTYENEQFILLDIYPKTNGTVSVAYGGLTKTITDTSGAEEPNAQPVFFGTFNGVSDSMVTPASGTLTIEGDYAAYGSGFYNYDSKNQSSYSGMRYITQMGKPKFIPGSAFKNIVNERIIIPEGVTKILDTNILFDGAIGVRYATEIRLPNSLEYIGRYAIDSLNLLYLRAITINIPQNIKEIGYYAFSNRSLKLPEYLELPNGLEKIDQGAFNANPCIKSIIIPKTVNTISGNPVAMCSLLESIQVDVNNDYYTSVENVLFNKSCSHLIAYPFNRGVTSYNVPVGVTTIGKYAFYQLSNLESITIPSSVTNLEDFSLYGTGINEFIFLSETPPSIVANTFYIVSESYTPKFIVPKGCGATYKAAEGWSKYADYIVEAS